MYHDVSADGMITEKKSHFATIIPDLNLIRWVEQTGMISSAKAMNKKPFGYD